MEMICQQSIVTLTPFFVLPTQPTHPTIYITFLSLSELVFHLQSISQKLVQLSHLRGNAEVNSPVTNFNDKTSNDIRVDL